MNCNITIVTIEIKHIFNSSFLFYLALLTVARLQYSYAIGIVPKWTRNSANSGKTSREISIANLFLTIQEEMFVSNEIT